MSEQQESAIQLYKDRRSKGVYNVGDIAFFTTDGMTKNPIRITELTEVLGYPRRCQIGRFGNYIINRHQVRHATDTEIEIWRSWFE